MTVVAGIAALAMATCVGYYYGRRAGARPLAWQKRTSRMALGRLAISLLVLLTARHIRYRFRAGRMVPGQAGVWALRIVAPLELLRCSVARAR
jgi:hypothetical protein